MSRIIYMCSQCSSWQTWVAVCSRCQCKVIKKKRKEKRERSDNKLGQVTAEVWKQRGVLFQVMSCYPKIPSLSLCLSPQVAQPTLALQWRASVLQSVRSGLASCPGWGGGGGAGSLKVLEQSTKVLTEMRVLNTVYTIFSILFYFIEYRINWKSTIYKKLCAK